MYDPRVRPWGLLLFRIVLYVCAICFFLMSLLAIAVFSPATRRHNVDVSSATVHH